MLKLLKGPRRTDVSLAGIELKSIKDYIVDKFVQLAFSVLRRVDCLRTGRVANNGREMVPAESTLGTEKGPLARRSIIGQSHVFILIQRLANEQRAQVCGFIHSSNSTVNQTAVCREVFCSIVGRASVLKKRYGSGFVQEL